MNKQMVTVAISWKC